jgi:hypothetical protein
MIPHISSCLAHSDLDWGLEVDLFPFLELRNLGRGLAVLQLDQIVFREPTVCIVVADKKELFDSVRTRWIFLVVTKVRSVCQW